MYDCILVKHALFRVPIVSSSDTAIDYYIPFCQRWVTLATLEGMVFVVRYNQRNTAAEMISRMILLRSLIYDWIQLKVQSWLLYYKASASCV